MPQDIDYDVPFPSLISPDAKAATAAHLDWVTRLGLLPTPEARASYLAWDIGGGGARMYPGARSSDLAIGVDMLGVCALCDDYFDELNDQQREQAAHVVLARLQGPDGSAAAGPPILEACADVWRRATATMSPRWQARVAGHYREAIAASVEEADLYRRGTTPSFDALLQLQGHLLTTGGVFLDLVERIGRYELPDEIFHAPEVRVIYVNCQHITAICNSAVSLDKEEARGQYLNLIIALESQRGLSRSQAVQETQLMVRKLSQEILRLRAELPEWYQRLGAPPHQKEPTRRYLDEICIFTRGYCDWYMTSGRYGTPARDPVASPGAH
ncbi:MAG TPA: hypothetical protein VLJ59_06975 [Mycobacteriales bacterium]|nr:hypothetical protein [Mycobacteriales bacterium]